MAQLAGGHCLCLPEKKLKVTESWYFTRIPLFLSLKPFCFKRRNRLLLTSYLLLVPTRVAYTLIGRPVSSGGEVGGDREKTAQHNNVVF